MITANTSRINTSDNIRTKIVYRMYLDKAKIRSILYSMVAAAMILAAAAAWGSEPAQNKAPAPGQKDKCPVCGMVVARYPDFVASVTLDDGRRLFFDGAKDMFKYLFNLEKYAPGKRASDVGAIFVTEYYDMKSVPARKAYYVIGSNVYGPMGRELIPFGSMKDALEFKKDHKGKRVVTFGQVTPALIRQLD